MTTTVAEFLDQLAKHPDAEDAVIPAGEAWRTLKVEVRYRLRYDADGRHIDLSGFFVATDA